MKCNGTVGGLSLSEIPHPLPPVKRLVRMPSPNFPGETSDNPIVAGSYFFRISFSDYPPCGKKNAAKKLLDICSSSQYVSH
jgi:hypothetical protein